MQRKTLPLTYRGATSAERRKRVKEILERVEMQEAMDHYPAQLSGGQQQRVAVARALAGDPVILLADEPTGNLDSKNGDAVMALLRELQQNGATICMVTHDPHYARYAERAIRLFDGRIVPNPVRVGRHSDLGIFFSRSAVASRPRVTAAYQTSCNLKLDSG